VPKERGVLLCFSKHISLWM